MQKTGPFEPLNDDVRRQMLIEVLRNISDEIWIFAYGSLMWDPAFRKLPQTQAKLAGYRRSFCVWTAHARGTVDCPGLALGLRTDARSSCSGIAIRLKLPADCAFLHAIWEREMWTGVYIPTWINATAGGLPLRALTFVVDEGHPQYSGQLTLAESARHIACASGVFGRCESYFFETLRSIAKLDSGSREFKNLSDAVRQEIESNQKPA